jgi:hypothetical protein
VAFANAGATTDRHDQALLARLSAQGIDFWFFGLRLTDVHYSFPSVVLTYFPQSSGHRMYLLQNERPSEGEP